MSKILLRRASSAEWAIFNPVLGPGEPGVNLDTGELKIGNGVQPWADLDNVGMGESVIPITADPGLEGARMHFGYAPLPDPSLMPNTIYVVVPAPEPTDTTASGALLLWGMAYRTDPRPGVATGLITLTGSAAPKGRQAVTATGSIIMWGTGTGLSSPNAIASGSLSITGTGTALASAPPGSGLGGSSLGTSPLGA